MGEKPQQACDSLGQVIRVRRQQLGLEFGDIQDSLKILRQYLQAIEAERYEKLPSLVYSTHIIKRYVAFLSLEEYGIAEVYIQRMEQFLHHAPTFILPLNRTGFFHRWMDVSRMLKWGMAMIVLSFSMFYLFWQVRATLRPPFLEVYQPDDQTVITDDAITVVGRSEPETEIAINDALVVGDRDGNFVTTIHLRPGVNIITITAKKKHGVEASLQRQIFMQQNIKTSTYRDKEMSSNYSHHY